MGGVFITTFFQNVISFTKRYVLWVQKANISDQIDISSIVIFLLYFILYTVVRRR